MSRLASLALCFAVACGSDVDVDRPDGGGATTIDAAADHVQPDGAAPLPATVCDEAAQHSDFAWIEASVLVPSCATAGCHTGPEPEVGLSLAAGEAYANLVNKGASTASGWTRVVPGAIAQSYLVVAVGRTAGPAPRDGFMPLGAEALCIPKLEAIERWIAAGALP